MEISIEAQLSCVLDILNLLNLLISHSYLQVLLPSNRTTVYDSLEPPVNQVFIFSERISDLKIEELEVLAKEFEGAVGVVLVDMYVLTTVMLIN